MLANTIHNVAKIWSPRLFQLGGVLLAGHAVTSGIKAFTTINAPPDMFVTTGHLVGLLGLLCLYPLLVSSSRLLSRFALVTGVLGALGWLGMTAAQMLVAAGNISSIGAVLPEPVIGLVLLSTILAYGLFFATATHSAWLTRRERILVIAPGLLVVVLVVDSAVTGASNLDGLLIGGALAWSMIALGRTIRTGRRSLRIGSPFSAVEG